MRKALTNLIFKNCAFILFVFGLAACQQPAEKQKAELEDVAGSLEVKDFMETFAGRGILSDSSTATAPENVLKTFHYPDDLALDLVLSEPEVTQPVFLNFDHKGRLWVVQYNQYPYPKGLKVLSMDQHIRATYDKVPEPPPTGVKGADKISFFEDTNGDGIFEKSTDAITGLNITTSVALGRGKIWVLAPPYLLAYTDSDDNGLPEGEPEIHLKGFGLEDTHAVANNLRWGPDGWLYGAQGSTCTANVSSSVTKEVRFDGQVIWRYHPESHIFEIFAEGGGNTFDVEIDDKGRLYAGDNGVTRGRYYKQGTYHVRNLGKHGAFTNSYTFGYLADMDLKGERVRFTHAFVRYQEESLPSRYHDRMLAINPMQNYVQLTSFEVKGSTFGTVDDARILQTDDHWFRPVDITTGPDGGVYIADWYDSRLSHVDPRDTWSKGTGRIYRLRNKNSSPAVESFDISKYSNEDLIQLLLNPSKWYRQQALLQFGNRKDISLVPRLKHLLTTNEGQTSLETYWAIALSGGFTDAVAKEGIYHKNPFVRMWAVRLLGDANNVSSETAAELVKLAVQEPHPEVRSQLAATAKRLPGNVAIPIVRNLLTGHNDVDDPDIPLQIWWALESKAVSNRTEILAMFEDDDIWSSRTVKEVILARLMQRWIMEGGDENYAACTRLLELTPSPEQARPLIQGVEEGLRGREVITLSPDLVRALQPYLSKYGTAPLSMALRRGQRKEVIKALEVITDGRANVGERLAYIRIFGEIKQPECVPVLLQLVENNQSSGAIRQASLEALSGYENPEIGSRVTAAYPDKLRHDPDVRSAALYLLVQRKTWAELLLNAIDRKTKPGEKFIAHTIDKADVPEPVARQMLLLNDLSISETVNRLWPGLGPATSAEKNNRINQIAQLLKSGTGDAKKGHVIFSNRCANCHRLFDEGASIGPELTGYDRKNLSDLLTNMVDPNAFIREGYETYHITTTDNRSLVGTLESKSGSTYTIKSVSGERVILGLEQINKMVEQQTSTMPEGLLNGLTDQQMRDVFSYIMNDL
jgi:putative membrane-bound dehydrogenase-like protein